MNILQQGIIALVRSALTQTPQVLPDGFCMEDAMSVIYDHNIQALCYDGAILCGIPNKGVLWKISSEPTVPPLLQ